MTTVAFTRGQMACDSCWTYGGAVDTLQKKIVRLKSGALLGQAGDNDARDVLGLLERVAQPKNLPSRAVLMNIRVDFLGLLVFPKGRMFKISTTFVSPDNWDADYQPEDLGLWEVSFPYAAIGSGSEIALGAMAAGKNAREAVMIACRHDLASRPPVHVLKLV